MLDRRGNVAILVLPSPPQSDVLRAQQRQRLRVCFIGPRGHRASAGEGSHHSLARPNPSLAMQRRGAAALPYRTPLPNFGKTGRFLQFHNVPVV